MFKGEGTINGEGEYGFMISAIDGDLKPNGGEDMFRIKIWELGTKDVIYDNQMGDDEDADPTTTIGGGSIVIHSGTDKKSELISPEEGSLSAIEIYPNPFTNTAYIEVLHTESIELMIDVYDMGGRCVRKLFSDEQLAGSHRIVWDGSDDLSRPLPSGTYFCHLRCRSGEDKLRLVIIR